MYKVLANSLKLVAENVISNFHYAFTKSRQTLDDTLIANEVMDEARKFKKKIILFKVDFEKAYDSVDYKMCYNGFNFKASHWKPDK
jgi:hypothetical protein